MYRDYLKFLRIKYLTQEFRKKYVQHSPDYYCDYKDALNEWMKVRSLMQITNSTRFFKHTFIGA